MKIEDEEIIKTEKGVSNQMWERFNCQAKTCVFHNWEEQWNCELSKFKKNPLGFVKKCPVRKGWIKLTKIICMDRYFHLHAKEFARYQRKWRGRNREYQSEIITMYKNRKKYKEQI
jgi:hypothetical protein